MNTTIHLTIANLRKQNHKSQQQLADFLGITKASVSKWETGQTSPDISSLPLIAAYFDTSIDHLLGYDAQLSKNEIERLYKTLKKAIMDSPENGLSQVRKLIKRYWSCYPFVFSMANLLLNHLTVLTKNDPITTQTLSNEIRELLDHVYRKSDDQDIQSQAKIMLSVLYLNNSKPQKVLELLGTTVPQLVPPESIIASAYHLQGNSERAEATMQTALYQYLVVMVSAFTNYLNLLDNNHQKFTELATKADQFITLFEIASFHPMIILNLDMGIAAGFMKYDDHPNALQFLEKFTNLQSKITFPVVLKGNHFFNKIDDWINQLMIGNQMPRDSRIVNRELKQFILENPTFEPLKNDPKYQSIVSQIKKDVK